MQNYHRKIKLAVHYKSDGDDIGTTPPPFMPKSLWTPPDDSLPPDLLQLILTDQTEFKKGFKFHEEKPNLTQAEVEALRDLISNKHIVIKPADKGSAVVIMARDQYIFEVKRQLQDTNYYKPLTEPIYLKTIPVVHAIIDTLKDKNLLMGSKQSQYLKGDKEPRERRFYILPKIHKDPTKWTVPHELPPGRPIVSDCGSETYQTAEFIDYYLYPLSILHPSYVKDTYHFIDIVKHLKIPQNSMFFSLDVDSLYTNIEIKTGLESVKQIFDKHPNPNRPDSEVLKLLEINLTRNDFVFDGEFYLQIKGTAMGKRFAPAHANIFMANWEEKVLVKCSKRPLHYLRYLDDIWGVWCYSEDEFKQFMAELNSHDPSIQLKHTTDYQSINFLDTTVYKGPSFGINGNLDIKVFFKETDTHALLFKSSFHPKHTFRGLVKSQLLRFNRICTQIDCFWEAVRILFRALRQRGYSRSFLKTCLNTFKEVKNRTTKEILPLITTYSSMSIVLNRRLKINFENFIGKKGILPNYEVAAFTTLKFVKNRFSKTIYKIDQVFTPQTHNCVYLIFCLKCGIQYVGETKNSIRTRMWQHRYNIKNNKEANTPLVNHFILHGMQALRVAGLQSHSCWTDIQRKMYERRWIYRLHTLEPIGLNIKRR
ncbi:hypothetical protein Q5P01_003169 [Channa striata]|uniref:GIY-YIG domain-containing protein n=1 Tax=Channa striata TaxID=64152 RepID=A0AA88NU48_CHASR|nr:hypothetical protein Q5P01_003169 [Channa striata]